MRNREASKGKRHAGLMIPLFNLMPLIFGPLHFLPFLLISRKGSLFYLLSALIEKIHPGDIMLNCFGWRLIEGENLKRAFLWFKNSLCDAIE